MEPIERRAILAGAGLVGAMALTRAARAGVLTPPPGPISPTGKTLQQIYDKIARGGDAGTPEARTPVQGLKGSPTAQFVIDAPGSYYLSGNITGEPGKCAIEVTADHVEIECDGFDFIGTQGTLSCIRASGRRCIGVYDGGFVRWFGTCVDMGDCTDCLVEECWFESCIAGAGTPPGPGVTVALGDGGVAYDCDVRKCFGATISLGHRSIFEECVCSEGAVATACFYSPGDTVMEDNFAHNCNGIAFMSLGRATVLYNRVVDCPGGVDVGEASVVEENDIDTSALSSGNGISIRGGRCCVYGNYVAGGGGGGGAIVVYQGGDGTLIEDNHIAGTSSSATGTVASGLIWIQPGVRQCHVIGNHSRGNSTTSTFYIPPGNSYGPMVVMPQGGDLSLVTNSNHPCANFIA